MKKWLTILGTAGLLLFPLAAIAADYGSQPSQEQVPPVAQTLVREGDFAIKLAAELDLGKPYDEATAEDMLTAAGVVPANGWLSDYPMTPDIIGQLKDAVSKAAAEGKLPMNNEEAVKGLYFLTAQMNLPTPAGPASQTPGSGQASTAPSDPSVVNNYYYDQGPPIVTYYPPPYGYGYMYDWVPYPAFWFGFWFPGFYICHNFTTVVLSPVFVDRRGVVTNHVIDPVTRRVAIVDPVSRTNGSVRPGTVLRTSSGRTFTNLPEMRQAMGGLVTKGPETRTPGNSAYRDRGFTTRESQRGAESIYRRSMDRTGPAPGDRLTYRDDRSRGAYGSARPSYGEGHRYMTPAPSGKSFKGPSPRGEERSVAPRMQERSYNDRGLRQSRSYTAPTAQRAPERTFNAPGTGRGGDGGKSMSMLRGRWRD